MWYWPYIIYTIIRKHQNRLIQNKTLLTENINVWVPSAKKNRNAKVTSSFLLLKRTRKPRTRIQGAKSSLFITQYGGGALKISYALRQRPIKVGSLGQPTHGEIHHSGHLYAPKHAVFQLQTCFFCLHVHGITAGWKGRGLRAVLLLFRLVNCSNVVQSFVVNIGALFGLVKISLSRKKTIYCRFVV